MTSSIRSPESPARSTAALTATAPMSKDATFFIVPPNDPIGVRQAEIDTMLDRFIGFLLSLLLNLKVGTFLNPHLIAFEGEDVE